MIKFGPAMIGFFGLFAVTASQAQGTGGSSASSSGFSYGDRGVQYESQDKNNFLWFGVRLQSRYSNEEVVQELQPGHPTERSSETKINRGRYKLGGHLISPRFTVYSEYDFPSDRLIDLRATYEFSERFNVRVGQWKGEFNRERVDSSGAQQFAERSISTPWFTIDRQQGIVASGRLARDSFIDSSYWFGWLSGAGRGGNLSEADGLWLGRYQWNVTGELLGFSQSDIGRRQKGAGSIALAVVDGETQYSSFSSAGGGQLPGFSGGDADKYRLQQLMVETAYQKNGFSWQQELHWKNIREQQTGHERRIIGGYAQAGVFLSTLWAGAPQPLELAIRTAYVDPDSFFQKDSEQEHSIVANWFFNGHRNKLTADISYIEEKFIPETTHRTRYRLQWDWSF